MRSLRDRLFAILALLGLAIPMVRAESLHERIDQLIADGQKEMATKPAPLSSDAEFLRRVSLDLIGRIPHASEARAFFSNRSPFKRIQLIDNLLASPEFARHLSNYLDVAFLDRRRDTKVPAGQWEEYLRQSIESGKPYDQLVREMLSADGTENRAPAKFYLERNLEPTITTRDISRLFLGRNMQCAQCHDHPLVEEYKQEHFFGIQAFFTRAFLYPNNEAATAVIAEKAEGETTFTSVFDKSKAQKMTAPKILSRKPIADPKIAKGLEYTVAPAKEVKPIPSYSRFSKLAGAIASGDNPAFRRTAANRFWSFLMGRGLVQPLDQDHEDNPPSHPELLDLLGDELAAHKFDLKWFLREIVLSQTYQRSSQLPEKAKEVAADRYAAGTVRPLSPEQLAFSIFEATGLAQAERTALGANLTESALNAKLSPQANRIARLFGTQPGEPEIDFSASLDQTLYLKHGGSIRSWIAPRKDNLLDRTLKMTDNNQVADELFLSIYTRLPDAEERRDLDAFLKANTDRKTALAETIWAMLASIEFRFNY
jgi:hypothetical protein